MTDDNIYTFDRLLDDADVHCSAGLKKLHDALRTDFDTMVQSSIESGRASEMNLKMRFVPDNNNKMLIKISLGHKKPANHPQELVLFYDDDKHLYGEDPNQTNLFS